MTHTHPRTLAKVVSAAALAVGAGVLIAQPPQKPVAPPDKAVTPGQPHAMSGHMMLSPTDLKWADAPNSLPPGCKIAVLEGDMSAPGPFTIRAKMPANYKIPAHFHPEVEHVTVLSGTMYMGMGDKLDTSKGTPLNAGGFGVMPIGAHHFAYTTDKETEIQVHGIGPWGITYVDPATDPRSKVPDK